MDLREGSWKRRLPCLKIAQSGDRFVAGFTHQDMKGMEDDDRTSKANNNSRKITLDEVAAHRTADDFWTVIHGVVYNMAGYTKNHPGGSMILMAAGTDSTIMYEQYHVLTSERKMAGILKGRQVGVLDKAQSPSMGPMYPELKRRVADRVLQEKEPVRPFSAQILFLVDVMLGFVLAYWGYTLDSDPASWFDTLQLFLASHLAAPLWLRLFGQCHALGHLHVFGSAQVRWARGVLLAVAAPGIGLSTHPQQLENPRRKMNEARVVSQTEFLQRRGPAEHQSVHHVRSANLEHDECLHVASVIGLTRISSYQKHVPILHHFQKYRAHEAFCAIAADIVLATAIPAVERVSLLVECFIPELMIFEIVTSLLGIFVSMLIARAHLLLVFSGTIPIESDSVLSSLSLGSFSPLGFGLFLAGFFVKHALVPSHGALFFAQHMWNNQVAEETADKDWIKHNAETSVSLRLVETSPDDCSNSWFSNFKATISHPVIWGNGGASASTVTYHLEHTLFPGINYLHLPKIASIVDDCCRKHGVSAKVVCGPRNLKHFYRTALASLSEPPKAGGGSGGCDTKKDRKAKTKGKLYLKAWLRWGLSIDRSRLIN